MKPDIIPFYDEDTSTITYLVIDPETRKAAIVDPVWDFDPKSGRTATASADRVVARVQEEGVTIDWILETHAHADHLSASQYLQDKLGGKIAIGAHIRDVQEVFKTVFNLSSDFATDGSQFDHLFEDGDTFKIGNMTARVMHTPGHTPACITYIIEDDAAFVGDTLFMPDYGTARADFPGGDATTMYRSIQKIFALPDDTRLFMCHDYQPGGREPQWETTVAAEKQKNIQVHEGVSEAEFVNMREERDSGLEMPVLILPSIQINIRAGHLPPEEDNGVSYLKLPVDAL